MTLARDEILSRLRRGLPAVFGGADVVSAYVFGSTARGEANDRSDIDLGVVVGASDRDPNVLLDLMRRVYAVTGLEVDVVIMNDARLRLLRRVLREGVLVYSSDEGARVDFEVRMRKLAQDYAIHADRMDRDLLTATAAGTR